MGSMIANLIQGWQMQDNAYWKDVIWAARVLAESWICVIMAWYRYGQLSETPACCAVTIKQKSNPSVREGWDDKKQFVIVL